jgi:hypothetical protein
MIPIGELLRGWIPDGWWQCGWRSHWDRSGGIVEIDGYWFVVWSSRTTGTVFSFYWCRGRDRSDTILCEWYLYLGISYVLI